MKKTFSLGAVLTVAGDRLMCEMGQVYEILNFMTGDDLFTHQLPRAAKECQPFLLKQHPWLSEYLPMQEQITCKTYKQFLDQCEKKWGKEIEVESLPANRHAFKDPIQELTDMVGPDKVLVVNKGN